MTEKTPNNFFYSNNDDKQLIQIIIQHPKTDNAKLYINTENWIKLIGGNILTQTNLINIEFDLMKQLGIDYTNYFKIIEFSREELNGYLDTTSYLMDHSLL